MYDGRVCNILAVSRAFGDWEFKGVGLVKLLSAGVERGFWPQEYADKQNFTADPVIVTPSTASAQLTEVRGEAGLLCDCVMPSITSVFAQLTGVHASSGRMCLFAFTPFIQPLITCLPSSASASSMRPAPLFICIK